MTAAATFAVVAVETVAELATKTLAVVAFRATVIPAEPGMTVEFVVTPSATIAYGLIVELYWSALSTTEIFRELPSSPGYFATHLTEDGRVRVS